MRGYKCKKITQTALYLKRLEISIGHFEEMRKHRRISAQLLVAYHVRKFIRRLRQKWMKKTLDRVAEITYLKKIVLI